MAKPEAVVAKIRKALETVPAVEIADGPVESSLDALDTLWLLSFFCNSAVRAAMQVTPKGQKKPNALYALPGNARPEYMLNQFTPTLHDVAEGDVIEVLCASEADVYQTKDDLDDYGTGRTTAEIAAIKTALREAAKHRYVGLVGPQRKFLITHAWPKLKAAALNGAMEVLGMIKSESNDWTGSPEEAQAVLALTKLGTDFPLRNPAQLRENSVEVNGAEIVVNPHRRLFLAMMLCRHRFPNGPWDFRTRQVEEAFWVHVEDENVRRTRERMRNISSADPEGQSKL